MNPGCFDCRDLGFHLDEAGIGNPEKFCLRPHERAQSCRLDGDAPCQWADHGNGVAV